MGEDWGGDEDPAWLTDGVSEDSLGKHLRCAQIGHRFAKSVPASSIHIVLSEEGERRGVSTGIQLTNYSHRALVEPCIVSLMCLVVGVWKQIRLVPHTVHNSSVNYIVH